jgi:hypothetical protein
MQELNPAIWEAIRMRTNDRGVLIGKTGGGKTTLAKYLVEDNLKPYSVTWNPKNSESITKWNQKHVTKLSELIDAEEPRLIYTPDPFYAEDKATQADFFYWIYERRYTRLYIDEATVVQYNGGMAPRYLSAVLNRGRERGVSTLTATQRPASIPMNVLSESEHFYVFKVNLPQDRQRIEALTGLTVEDQADLEDFEFYYFHVSRGLLPRKIKINKEWLNYGNGKPTPTGSRRTARRESTNAAIAV